MTTKTIKTSDGQWKPRRHMYADPREVPKFDTEAKAEAHHEATKARCRELGEQLGCRSQMPAIAFAVKQAGIFRRISREQRSDLADDAGIDARHFVRPAEDVCNATEWELEQLECFV